MSNKSYKHNCNLVELSMHIYYLPPPPNPHTHTISIFFTIYYCTLKKKNNAEIKRECELICFSTAFKKQNNINSDNIELINLEDHIDNRFEIPLYK